MGNKIKWKEWSAIGGLIVLLLIAPCNVRNAVETLLDIPVTTSLNKSKTVSVNEECKIHSGEDYSWGQLEHKRDVDYLSRFEFPSVKIAVSSLLVADFFLKISGEVKNSLPLYILFQQLRLHS